jgi:hypothetical protein
MGSTPGYLRGEAQSGVTVAITGFVPNSIFYFIRYVSVSYEHSENGNPRRARTKTACRTIELTYFGAWAAASAPSRTAE